MQNNNIATPEMFNLALETLRRLSSPELLEAALEKLATDMINNFHTNSDLPNFFYAMIEEKDPFKRKFVLRVLCNENININAVFNDITERENITNYLVAVLSDKTNLEHYLGPSYNGMVLTGGVVTLMLGSLYIGFLAAGTIGGLIGFALGYKVVNEAIKHVYKGDDRILAAKALANCGISNQEIIDKLNERIDDTNEHEEVKIAAESALDKLQPQANNSPTFR